MQLHTMSQRLHYHRQHRPSLQVESWLLELGSGSGFRTPLAVEGQERRGGGGSAEKASARGGAGRRRGGREGADAQ